MGVNGTKPYVVFKEWKETPEYSNVPLTVFLTGEGPTKKKPREYEPEKLNSFHLKGEEYWLVYNGKGRLDPDLILELWVRGWPRDPYNCRNFGRYLVEKLAQNNRYNEFRDRLKKRHPNESLDNVVQYLIKHIAPARVDL